jgi:hypothetical protein
MPIAQHRDWLDWLGLGASLLVAPAFALLAAREGAKVGGAEARRAALEVQEREAVEAQKLRAEDRATKRHQMCTRIERTLSRVVALGDDLSGEAETIALSACAAELRILWESFERQSADLYLVGTPAFQARVERCVAGLHTMVAATDATLESQSQMRQAEISGSGRSGRGINNILTQYDPTPLLDKFRALVIEKGKEAATLLDELERIRTDDIGPIGGPHP